MVLRTDAFRDHADTLTEQRMYILLDAAVPLFNHPLFLLLLFLVWFHGLSSFFPSWLSHSFRSSHLYGLLFFKLSPLSSRVYVRRFLVSPPFLFTSRSIAPSLSRSSESI